MFDPFKDFEINIYLPFDINFEKYYKQQQYYDENLELKVKEFNVFNYYGGLSNPSIGFQYTYYTNTINDIHFNISIPTGYFPMFRFESTHGLIPGRIPWIPDIRLSRRCMQWQTVD